MIRRGSAVAFADDPRAPKFFVRVGGCRHAPLGGPAGSSPASPARKIGDVLRAVRVCQACCFFCRAIRSAEKMKVSGKRTWRLAVRQASPSSQAPPASHCIF